MRTRKRMRSSQKGEKKGGGGGRRGKEGSEKGGERGEAFRFRFISLSLIASDQRGGDSFASFSEAKHARPSRFLKKTARDDNDEG